MAYSKMTNVTRRLDDCRLHCDEDAHREISMLYHDNVSTDDIDRIIKNLRCVTASDGIMDTKVTRHGMRSCTWRGKSLKSCGEFATDLLCTATRNVPIWIKHTTDEGLGVSMHDNKFHLKVCIPSFSFLVGL